MVQNNPPASRGRPSSYDLDLVVARATAVFWAEGYAEVSVDDLEKATGLNRSSLYTSLDGKRGLFERCLRAYVDSSVAEQFRPAVEGEGGVDDLLALIDRVVARLAANDHPPGCFATLSLVRGEGGVIAAESRAELVRAIRATLTRAETTDALDASRTESRVALVESALLGMLVLGRADGIDLGSLAAGLRTQVAAWRDDPPTRDASLG